MFALAAGATGSLAGAQDYAQRLPAGYPLPLFEWAVTTELASRIAYACDAHVLDRARVDVLLEQAVTGAFGNDAAYDAWRAESMSNADHLSVFELVRAEVAWRGTAQGFDLSDRAALCAFGDLQVAQGSPAGWLIGAGG
ncbi:hypothetical protein [Halovulum dunhuangense]|nr:hypothetical protein [Halovulum dunhuangense]